MEIFIALLYLASASLTVLGAVGIWEKAKRNSLRMKKAIASLSPSEPSYDSVETAMKITVKGLEEGEESTRADLWLICGGIGFGTVASILSLCL